MGISSFIGKMVGSGVGQTASQIADIVDRFVETKEEKKAAEILLMKVQQEPDKWQAEINKVGAGHRSVFIAGWRPFIGWVCGLALAWGWLVGPIFVFFLNAFGKKMELPKINVGEAITLVMALLGLAATRTYEKKSGLTG